MISGYATKTMVQNSINDQEIQLVPTWVLPLLWELMEHEMSLESQGTHRGRQWHLITSVALTRSQQINSIGQKINLSLLRVIGWAISNLQI